MPKVFKNGNSLVVSVPKTYAYQLSIRDGSTVKWENRDEGLLLVHEKRAKKATEIDPKIVELIDKIDKKYTQVWADLSKV